jgi:hypothetical protein
MHGEGCDTSINGELLEGGCADLWETLLECGTVSGYIDFNHYAFLAVWAYG